MRFIFVLFCLFSISAFSQTNTDLQKDSTKLSVANKSTVITKKPDSLKQILKRKAFINPHILNLVDSNKVKNISTKFLQKKDTQKPKENIVLNNRILIPKVGVDSISSSDSINNNSADSVLPVTKKAEYDYNILTENPILITQNSVYMITDFKTFKSSDYLFFLLIGIVFFAALVQVLFSKYIKNIFDIFFQPNFRQKQTKDQINQEFFASLMLNILFIFSSSTFISIISIRYNIVNFSFWQTFLGSSALLTIIYSLKLFITQFMGWVYQKQEVASSYNFIVYIINKIIGIILIPLSILFVYGNFELQKLAYTLASITITLLFFYRFFYAFKTLSGRLKITIYHFFLYFCSVEILPLLILYKALREYINSSI